VSLFETEIGVRTNTGRRSRFWALGLVSERMRFLFSQVLINAETGCGTKFQKNIRRCISFP
jgi:hypothetical protein